MTLGNGESVKPASVASTVEVSEHTARDALNTMAEKDILKRDILEDDTVRYIADPDFETKLLERLVDERVVLSSSDY
jgi:predicted DNA-binding transcriptional regulator